MRSRLWSGSWCSVWAVCYGGYAVPRRRRRLISGQIDGMMLGELLIIEGELILIPSSQSSFAACVPQPYKGVRYDELARRPLPSMNVIRTQIPEV
jgi:hypothetical protein